MRDSANAARLAATTVPSAENVAVMRLAAYQLRMSPCSSNVRNDSRVGFSIFQVGFVVSALGLIAVSTAQNNGTSHSNANAISTPTQVALNTRMRRSTDAATGDGRSAAAVSERSVMVVISQLRFLAAGHGEPHRGHREHHEEEQGGRGGG